MITIQILNGKNEVVLSVRELFGCTIDEELNGSGSINLSFPITNYSRKAKITRGYKIKAYYSLESGKYIQVFDGYIHKLTITSEVVEILGYNRISYLQHRFFHESKEYVEAPVYHIVQEGYYLMNNQIGVNLPFTLRTNNATKSISVEVERGTSFQHFLDEVYELDESVQYRVVGEEGISYLDFGYNIGKDLPGVRAFNINNLRAGNIQDWKWESALDNFRNAMYAIDDEEKTQLARDSESIEEIGLVFEHYEHEKFLNARVNVNEVAVPSISLTPDTDWWNIQVGDRKNISIISAYDWLLLQYQGVIQQRRIAITGNSIAVEMTISEKYVKTQNVLDGILSLIDKKIEKLSK